MLERSITDGCILIVEDEPANVRVLTRLLRRAGYERVVSTTDPRKARELFLESAPDLILLDLHMPHLDGFQVMSILEPEIPDETYLPILVLTGDQEIETRKRALAAGARDFVTKPFEVTEVLLRIKNLLDTRFLHLELQRQNQDLEERVQERTRELAEAQVEILHRLALAAEYRDDVTGQHAERVGIYSALIAEEMGLPREEVSLIRRAAPLHDVGKIGIPDAILMKPAGLTPQEAEIMKTHTEIGCRILSGSRFPLLRLAREIARTHHERWDGRGYTTRMEGEEIPLVGRIVAVADVFDCMTHARPYKEAWSAEAALAEILRLRGHHFDPRVVDAFVRVVRSGKVAPEPSRADSVTLPGTWAAVRRTLGDLEAENLTNGPKQREDLVSWPTLPALAPIHEAPAHAHPS